MNSHDKISYPEDGNAICFQLEDNSFWFRQRNKIIRDVVSKYKKSGTFADVGGGNGFVSLMLQNEFSDLNVTLIEPGSEGCENAKKRGVENTHLGILSSFKNIDQFDNIGLFDVIEHIQNDKEFLCEVKARLSDNGRVFITVPAYQFLWSKEDVDAGHFRRYSFSQFEQLVVSSGFRVVYGSYIFATLVPLIFLLRSMPFRLGIAQKRDAQQDHRSSWVAYILEKLLDLEFLITKNMSIKFGASIILCIE